MWRLVVGVLLSKVNVVFRVVVGLLQFATLIQVDGLAVRTSVDMPEVPGSNPGRTYHDVMNLFCDFRFFFF